jgi:hypothetical protein
MRWVRYNRDALVITVVGGLLVHVGGGVILAGVIPRVGDVVGVRVNRPGAVGVRVVAVSAWGATLKAAAKRAPRGSRACLRGPG